MEEGFVRIHKYMRADASFAGYDAKIAMFMLVCFLCGLLFSNSTIVIVALTVFGVVVGSKLQEYSDMKLKGFLQHLKYYFGFLDSTLSRQIPPSNIKEFIG